MPADGVRDDEVARDHHLHKRRRAPQAREQARALVHEVLEQLRAAGEQAHLQAAMHVWGFGKVAAELLCERRVSTRVKIRLES